MSKSTRKNSTTHPNHAAELIRSKDILDYFEAKLSDLVPGRTITFMIHLYFKQNEHIMIFKKTGDTPTALFLRHYASRGINKIWIYKDDRIAFDEYMKTRVWPEEDVTEPDPLPSLTQSVKSYAQNMTQLIESVETQFNPEEKKKTTALIAKNSRSIFKEATEPQSVMNQEKSNAAARAIVKDVVDTIHNSTKETAAAKGKSIFNDLWNVTQFKPELTHSANVATYAVLFSLALGESNLEFISDIALAALLHDVGLSQIPLEIAAKPWHALTPEQQNNYSEHVKAGLGVIQRFGINLPDRIKRLIERHHEKFDGSGYPNHLDKFKTDPSSQLLALAELLDSVASGQWDGTKRSYHDSLDTLKTMEQSNTLPEYFKPEILSAVLSWTNRPTAQHKDIAVQTVQRQIKKLLQKKA